MSSAAALFDTSIYIPYLRGEAYTDLIERALQTGQVYLSSVVLAELYAGTRSARDKADLDIVRQSYQTLGRLVTPTASDWARAGQAIRRYGRLYGTLDPREHMNDVLILLSGAAVGCAGHDREYQAFSKLGTTFPTHANFCSCARGPTGSVPGLKEDDHGWSPIRH